MLYSVIIPVLNESGSLRQLVAELSELADQHQLVMEFVFVDDGSTDNSWSIIQQLASSDARVKGVKFRRNFGKAAALSAGFETAEGSILFTMDADLQDNPKEIPRFLEQLDHYDVVSGWKKIRYDPWHKILPSRVFNGLVSWLTGVKLHDHNCGFKCYRAEIFDEVQLYGELHRFVPVLAAARGWRIGEVVVEHRPRTHGHSKYGWARIPKGFLDLLTVKFLTGYGQRPQHLLGTVGLLGFSFGTLGVFIMTARWFLSRVFTGWEEVHLHQRAIFFYSLTALLLGAQFIAVGFLAELITARSNRQNRGYSIADRTGDSDESSTTGLVRPPHLLDRDRPTPASQDSPEST